MELKRCFTDPAEFRELHIALPMRRASDDRASCCPRMSIFISLGRTVNLLFVSMYLMGAAETFMDQPEPHLQKKIVINASRNSAVWSLVIWPQSIFSRPLPLQVRIVCCNHVNSLTWSVLMPWMPFESINVLPERLAEELSARQALSSPRFCLDDEFQKYCQTLRMMPHSFPEICV